jgi:hypothetical protein
LSTGIDVITRGIDPMENLTVRVLEDHLPQIFVVGV